MRPSVAPESPSVGSRHKYLGLALGVVLILAGNLLLRCGLEHTRLPAYPIFPDDTVPLSWRLLLPTDIGAADHAIHKPGSYHWFTTGMTVVKFAEQYASPNDVFYALNALVIVATFVCTWWMFRSAVFSYTVTLCMAFGTQLSWVYVCSTLQAFYLYVIFLEANLLCLAKVLRGGGRRWQAAYATTLVLLALNHEQWLSYFAFLMLAVPFLWLYALRAPAPALKPRLLFLAGCSGLVAVVYLAIRLQYGQQQSRLGDEDEMIFTYASRTLAVEDFISNVFTYIYLTVSNYFPPLLVSSNSLYRHGAQGVIAEQHGYHAEQTHLVAMHHVFYWYYFAGVVFAAFVYCLVRGAPAALRPGGSVRAVHLTLCLLMIAAGFSIHALIKYRPYMSVPLLTYKCSTSNVGMAYLVGFALTYARAWLPARRLYPAVVALAWGVIVYGALARPAYLTHLSHQVGMTALPDPLRHLRPKHE